MRNVYSKQKLKELYGKYTLISNDGEVEDNKTYIVNGFKQHHGTVVVQVEEVQLCK